MKWDEWRGGLDGRKTMLVKRLFSFRGWRVDLHKFIAADAPECYHSHTAKAWRIILWGGYTEEVPNHNLRDWHAGMVGAIKPEFVHRVSEIYRNSPAYSFWVRAPKVTEVKLIGTGWILGDK